MLKKIAIFLFVLLIIQMAMFARLHAEELVNQVESITTKIVGDKPTASGTDYDIDAYLNDQGIKTSVNEEELNAKYGTQLFIDPIDGKTTISFRNPNAHGYKLEIYDINKGLVATFVNINGQQITIDKELFASGAYIFKLEGDQNLFCGTFVL
jgi:hypothetical protein